MDNEGSVMYPDLGDIWLNDDGDYYLFISQPNYSEDTGFADVLCLNDGTKVRAIFDVQNSWNMWEKVI